MPNDAQIILDTRALEIATQSKTLIDAHVAECKEDRRDRREQFEQIQAAIVAMNIAVSAQTQKAMRWAIGLLIAAVGYYLITVGVPGDGRHTVITTTETESHTTPH